MQIAAELRGHGHEARIVDYCMHEASADFSELAGADIVGLSVMSPQLPQAIAIAEALSARCVTVVWGGVHVSLDPQSILSRFPRHYVIRGEGEFALLDLISFLEGKESPEWIRQRPGVCFYDGTAPVINSPAYIADLNVLSDVDYFTLGDDLERYLQTEDYFFGMPVSRLQVLVARGCHWNCTFCINPIYKAMGAKHRTKSFEKIRREAEPVIDALNIIFVEPRDEDFFIKRELLDSWSSFAREKKLLWSANGRFNYFRDNLLSKEKLAELVDSGLYAVGMSIETGDETIRNTVIKKQVKDTDIERTMAYIESAAGRRIAVATSFIAYFPGDTSLSRRKIINLMFNVSKNSNAVFSGPQIYRSYPGSPLYDQEETKYVGDINYYLNNLLGGGGNSGSNISISRKLDAKFYGDMLPVYFNGYFRRFHLNPPGSPVRWSVVDSENGFQKPLYMSMTSLRWRNRFNRWELFIDPWVIPVFYNVLKWFLPKGERAILAVRRCHWWVAGGVAKVLRALNPLGRLGVMRGLRRWRAKLSRGREG
jgi:radical SAM superfamily enzyme YgiQ (UPF0313 family)